MATNLTPNQMKELVRNHFEDFVNKRNALMIRINMTPDFYDHDGPGGKPTDLDGDEKMMIAMYKTMPDLDSPWMFAIIQKKLGAEAPKRVVIPEPITTNEHIRNRWN
jgi:hypothetical protein